MSDPQDDDDGLAKETENAMKTDGAKQLFAYVAAVRKQGRLVQIGAARTPPPPFTGEILKAERRVSRKRTKR
jgi:D-arabinose 1-dehydrogenase-like Zn-dependent alcohol dehydrogenase